MKRPLALFLALLAGAIGALAVLGLVDRLIVTVDQEQAGICRRIIPALPGEPRLDAMRVRQGAGGREIRIDYEREEAGQRVPAWLACRFAGAGLDPGRREIVALKTETGEISEATLYFLRRFWLTTPDAMTHDPGAPPPWKAVQVPYPVAYGAQQLMAALPSAAVYGLIAAAYALIYGLIGRIMLGFGEFAALGSIAGVVTVAGALRLDATTPMSGVLLAAGAALTVSALHGFVAGRLIFRPLRRAGGQQVLIATVGLTLALSEYLRLAQGNETRWLPPVLNQPLPVVAAGSFTATISPVVILMALLGLAVCAGLIWHLARSRFGREWRALADDPRMAELLGVDGQRVYDRAIILACVSSALAGIIITVIFGGLGYAGGLVVGLKGLVAAVLGGIGSVRGAVLGGLAIALIEALWSAWLPIEHRDLVVFLLLSVVLIVRPGGFFGEPALTPRSV